VTLSPFVSYGEINLHIRGMGKIVYWSFDAHFGFFFFQNYHNSSALKVKKKCLGRRAQRRHQGSRAGWWQRPPSTFTAAQSPARDEQAAG